MLADQNKKSFTTSFWVIAIDKGDQGAGFQVLLSRTKQGKRISDYIQQLYKERAMIEEEYSKKLLKLSKIFSNIEEIGTMGESLNVVKWYLCLKSELEQQAMAHLELSNDLRLQLAVPLQEFTDQQSQTRKHHAKIMEKSSQQSNLSQQQVIKARARYYQKTNEFFQCEEQVRLAPAGRDNEKMIVKLERTLNQQRQFEQEYSLNVQKNAEIHDQWNSDMLNACRDFEKLELDRFNYTRASLWKYSNQLSSACVLNDESSERIRISLEQSNFDKDLQKFISLHETGSLIPEPLPFEPFRQAQKQAIAKNIDSHYSTETVSDNASDMQNTGEKQFMFQSSNNIPTQCQVNKKPTLKNQKSLLLSQSKLDSTYYDPYDIPNHILFTVRGVYDYDATAPEELNIKRGQLIPVTQTHEDGWWEGILLQGNEKRRGLFPSNFCENT